jgi:hypothetical protein
LAEAILSQGDQIVFCKCGIYPAAIVPLTLAEYIPSSGGDRQKRREKEVPLGGGIYSTVIIIFSSAEFIPPVFQTGF